MTKRNRKRRRKRRRRYLLSSRQLRSTDPQIVNSSIFIHPTMNQQWMFEPLRNEGNEIWKELAL